MIRHLVFWLWNDRMTPARIRRQLSMMKDAGVGGVFFHSMPREFGGAQYPEGMPGYLSTYYFRMIREAVSTAAELGMESWLYDEGGWPSGTLNGELVRKHPEWRAQFLVPGTPEGKIEKKFIDNRPDLLRPETTRYFIKRVHRRYFETLGPELWKHIRGIFSDEPFFGCLQPSEKGLPCSDALAAELRKRGGSVEKNAAEIFFGTAAESEQALRIWRDALTALINRNWFEPLRSWCGEHGILFTGHPGGDDFPAKIGQYYGDGFEMYRQFDIPGLDAIWHQISPREMEVDYPKYITSSARQTGKRRVFSESFAVYGADCSLREMRQIADAQYVLGVTDVIPMALYASTRGARQFEHHCNLFAPDPRWNFYRDFAAYTTRLGSLLADGKPHADIAVLLPYNSLIREPLVWGIQSRKLPAETPFFLQTRWLRENHFGYDYAGENDLLNAVGTEDGKLRIGKTAYRAVMIPDGIPLSPALERKISRLKQESFPVFSGREAAQIRDIADPDLNLTGNHSSIRVLKLQTDDAPFFFLFNSSADAAEFTCRNSFSEAYEWYDPLTDAAHSLHPDKPEILSGLRSIVLRPRTCLCSEVPEEKGKIPFDGPWRRKKIRSHIFSDHGFRTVPVQKEKTENGCGVFEYANTITLKTLPESLTFSLPEEISGMWSIRINGREAGKTAWTPFEISLSEFLRLGKNRIVCRLVTTAGGVYHDTALLRDLECRGWINPYLSSCCLPFPADPLPEAEALPRFLRIL